ncbi:MAG: M20/M25/M40 family metallo-hydrolase [Rhodobacteraceae bacterium]|nr:M20/M25/M40 family metallo-hydrolase [Paracoccaceae bacterium]
MLEQLLSEADRNFEGSIERLFELLRIPSISTDTRYKGGCNDAAHLLQSQLNDLGFAAKTRKTAGHPVVVAHGNRNKGEGLVFYGHYDVQPVDPIDEWMSKPFEPAIRNSNGEKAIFARGASDNKGQLTTFIEALRVWKKVTGELPNGISLLLEGEEECGSPSLPAFLEENASELVAELALICDTGLFDSRTPAIITQLRGLLGEELEIQGPRVDLHSGMYGGLVRNPIILLSQILAGLHDANGRIALPRFYDGVSEPDPEILKQWRDLDFDCEGFLGHVGLSQASGEQDRLPLEILWSRPTYDVNGVWGGYRDEGFKTVLPSSAGAKLSFRLVGKQEPLEIRKSLRSYIRSCLPPDFEVDFTGHGAARACQMSTDHQLFDATRQALGTEWNSEAVFAGCGGSIPVTAHFQDILGMDSLLTGFARDDDNVHSPNEKYNVDNFCKGIRSWLRILYAVS